MPFASRHLFARFRAGLAALTVTTLLAVALAPTAWAAPNNGLTGPRTGVWAHEASQLKPDPAVVWGRLDNGLRYALLPHKGVPGRVTLWLVVLAGSLDETDQELGIAHYIEHLAFRASRHFTAEAKIQFFQRLGMEAGSDVNAHTSRDHTAYKLEFRETTPELLGQGLLLLRDIADGVQFKPDEINQERGVIVSEWRGGESLAEKGVMASWPVLFKGMRFPIRDPIGKPEVFKQFTHETFMGYYTRCYRSDQMIVVAAGDFDGAGLANMVRGQFNDMVKPKVAPPVRDEGKLDMGKNLRAGVYKITNVGSASAVVGCASPIAAKPDSKVAREETFRRNYVFSLLNQRVGKATEGNGEAVYYRIWGTEASIVTAEVSSDTWPTDLGILDDLVRFTYQNGFEQREIDMAKRRYVNQADFMIEQRGTIDPSYLCEQLSTSITDNLVYVGFEQSWRWQREWLDKITARDLLLSFQSSWDLDRMAFHLAGDVEIEGGGAEIIKKVQQDRKGGIRYFRPDTRKEIEFVLPTWGTPTGVVEESDVPELGARLLRFGNNVRVNFARNRSEPGLVYVVARVGNGLLEMPNNRPALKQFGLHTVLASGTTHFTVEQIGELIEDHLNYFTFDLDDMDAFAFRGMSAPDKLDVCLSIITDYLHRPNFASITHREEKMKALITGLFSHFGMGEGMREMQNHLFKGDARFTWVSEPKDFLGLSLNDVRNWLQEPLTHGYVELTIVGDITEEAVVASVSRTLGSLPTRAAEKKLLTTPRPLKVTAPAGYARIEFIGEQHQAIVMGNWPVEADYTTKDRATLEVLVKVLQERIWHEVREKLGLAYSPNAEFTPYTGFPNFAMMQAMIDCDPSEASRVAKLIEELGDDLARNGATENELMGARGILSGQVRQWFHNAGFLMSLLPRAQERPDTLQEAIALHSGLLAEVTLADVNAWATKVFGRKNSRTAAIVPKQFIGIFQTGQ